MLSSAKIDVKGFIPAKQKNGLHSFCWLHMACCIACLAITPSQAQNPGVSEETWVAYEEAIREANRIEESFPEFNLEPPCEGLECKAGDDELYDCKDEIGQYIRAVDDYRENDLEHWRDSQVERGFNDTILKKFNDLNANIWRAAGERKNRIDDEYRHLPPDDRYEEEQRLYREARSMNREANRLYKALLNRYQTLIDEFYQRKGIDNYQAKEKIARSRQAKVIRCLNY